MNGVFGTFLARFSYVLTGRGGCGRIYGRRPSRARVADVRDEVQEFIEFVEDTDDSGARERVLKHLRSTKFVIACQLPTSDIEDDGYDANDTLLSYFEKHCGGMIQADGEGFYDGNSLVVKLES